LIKKINFKLKTITNSEFNRNFFRLFQGTVAAQLLPILAAPIISRLFSPDQIGEFAFYASIISICIGLVCLNIDRAIVLPGNSREAKRLIEIALKISFRFSVLAFIVLTGLKILHLLNYIKDFPWWWFLLSIHIFIFGLFQVGNYTLSRNKMFRELGRSRIYNGVSYSILQIASYKLESLGLVASSLVSRSFSSMNYMLQMKKTGNITTKTLLNLPNKFTKFEKILMKKYKDFLIFGTSITTLNNTSNQLPIILLQSLYSMQSAGIYSWANRIIQMPTGLITQAINQVFYQDVSERIREKKPILNLVKSTTKKLFVIGVIPYAILFALAPQIFGFVFGEKWTLAGEYTRCLIPWLFISFLNSPITSVISAYGKQKMHFYNEIILLIFRFLSLIIGYLIWDDAFMSVLLFGIVGFIYSIYMYFYLLKIVKENEPL
jgi:O-antigen/teichoic acid export membrane protein